MNFDSVSYESSISSDDDSTLYDQMNKTKTQPTKFFNDLNRHQKFLSRKMVPSLDSNKKQSTRKNHKRSPTFKQMLMASRKYLEDSTETNFPKGQGTSKKKVRFNSDRQSQNDKKNRKPSIQKNAAFNFYQSIKQMAFELTESKKTTVDQKNSEEKNDKTNQDLFTGYTQKQFQDGTRFKGICQNGVIIKGELHFSNGFVYDGQLFLDKFHGRGKLILPKHQVIQADWVQGQIVGKATIKYPMGQIYYGDIKNYKRHGKGHLFFNDESKYEGEFNEGQLTGYGIHITSVGEKTSGYWFYGDFVGTNQQVYQNVMNNAAAHQNKKSQKQNKQLNILKRKSSRRSKNVVEQLFLNMENLA